mmetsp:Transcript_71310/g.99067  ORF Transcript_71310/g.99067 Transcript_71310/m.99067 type:complete len:202 (-) Transcript_71310:15-620(-)
MHRGVFFTQRAYFRPFIEQNTRLRKEAERGEAQADLVVSVRLQKVVVPEVRHPQLRQVQNTCTSVHRSFSNLLLKAKMYSVITDEIADDDTSEKDGMKVRALTGKGVPDAVRKHITHGRYKATLLTNTDLIQHLYGIRSSDHKITTRKMEKVCANAFDDKEYIVADWIETLKYGHKSIPEVDKALKIREVLGTVNKLTQES